MTSTQDRRASIDALRGLAVILMVQQHLGAWLLDIRTHYWNLSKGWALLNATGGAAAPLFITLAGAGVSLSVFRKQKDDATRTANSELGRDTQLIFRGFALLLFGTLLNLCTPSWFSPWSFYVLHLIGSFFLLAFFVRQSSNALLLFLAALVLLLGAAGQAWLQTPLKLSSTLMGSISRPGGALRLALFEGRFPILPWFSLALGGLWAGRMLHEKRIRSLLVAGAFCGGLAGGLRLLVTVDRSLVQSLPFRGIFRFTFYPATTVFLLVLFAICLGLIALFAWLEERRFLTDRSWLVPLGQSSLSLLFVHIVLFRELAEGWGYRRTLDPWPTLGAIVLTLAVWATLAHYWKRANYRFGLEWALRAIGRIGQPHLKFKRESGPSPR